MRTISLCMIVKDEESNIRRLLESVSDAVDEIIIVDTGSVDHTKDICLEFNAKVYDFPWEGDFAKARNFGLEKASSDWILWMDADEKLIVKNKEQLNEFLQREEEQIYSIKMLHLYGTDAMDETKHYISYNFRLFKNKLGINFKGKIHERLELEDENEFDRVNLCDAIEILHYGYMEEYVGEKSFRNLKLLIHQKEIHKENPWLDYHIAAELYRLNDTKNAFAFVNHGIARFLYQNIMPPALAYKLKYDILISTNSVENAYKGLEKAIELYPDYVELHFYRGMILYYLKQYDDALKTFSYCLILGEGNLKYLIRFGSGSFYAYYYIGECYEKLSKYEHAKEAYRQSILYHPTLNLEKIKQDIPRIETMNKYR